MYAFALLKTVFPDHPFRESRKFEKLWTHAKTEGYEKRLYESDFAYPYNPPGFEMAYALEIFETRVNDRRHKQRKWLTEQVRLCFDFKSGLMTKGSKDPVTCASRIYEAVRLPDIELNQ